MTCKYLTESYRAQIEVLSKEGYGLRSIARLVERAASTISGELRCRRGPYSAVRAQQDAVRQASRPRRKPVLCASRRREIRRGMGEG
jgi:IS30 family transposase